MSGKRSSLVWAKAVVAWTTISAARIRQKRKALVMDKGTPPQNVFRFWNCSTDLRTDRKREKFITFRAHLRFHRRAQLHLRNGGLRLCLGSGECCFRSCDA